MSRAVMATVAPPPFVDSTASLAGSTHGECPPVCGSPAPTGDDA
jgi:hypothetical protein